MSYITAANANRTFSAMLREVREGRSYVITSHGRPVARMVPFGDDAAATGVARAALFDRLGSRRAQNLARVTRDDLYER